jgi:peroxiredoxin
MPKLLVALFVLISFADSSSAAQIDPGALLRTAADRYRGTKTFHIVWQATITEKSDVFQSWSKQDYDIAADGDKFYLHADGGGLRSTEISNGSDYWSYDPTREQYRVQALNKGAERGLSQTPSPSPERSKQNVMQILLSLATEAPAAELLAPETITIAGKPAKCNVVRTVHESSFRPGVTNRRESTYWIDASQGLVRKILLRTAGPQRTGDPNEVRSVEIIYSLVDLTHSPDGTLFSFVPPKGALLVEDTRGPERQLIRLGEPARPLRLKDRNGQTVDISDYKGKAIVLSFWSSWCGVCTTELKNLSALQQAQSRKGVVFLAVDREYQSSTQGDEFLASQKIEWTNLHDEGAIAHRDWGVSGVPVLTVVDRDGKVAWVNAGWDKGVPEQLAAVLARFEASRPR